MQAKITNAVFDGSGGIEVTFDLEKPDGTTLMANCVETIHSFDQLLAAAQRAASDFRAEQRLQAELAKITIGDTISGL